MAKEDPNSGDKSKTVVKRLIKNSVNMDNSVQPQIKTNLTRQMEAMQRLAMKVEALQRLDRASSTIKNRAETPRSSPSSVKPSSAIPSNQFNYIRDIQHIRMQDPGESPLPMGNQCSLCKRDLTFTPEGPVLQPKTPPAAAVLACGHAFHDQCLQNITPQDEAKNPPCIPCILGES